MNNGLTGAGRQHKKMIQRIYGTPKGSATRVGMLNQTSWTYRGFKLSSSLNAGWSAGRTWIATDGETGFSGRSKQIVMVQVDWHLDGAPPPNGTKEEE